MPEIRHDSFLTKNDLLYIESVLLKPLDEELALRQIARVNPSYPRFAREIGYDVYKREGKAKVHAAGGRVKDIPFVGEEIDRTTQPAVDIATGIRYNEDELEAMQAKRSLGKGPAFSLDQSRIDAARRFVSEQEDFIGFNGDSSLKIQGVLNKTGIQAEDVAEGATGANATEKKKWENKTSLEILKDLHTAKTKVENSGHFNATTLVLSTEAKNRMLKPLNDVATLTLLKWLESEGLFFKKIITTNALKGANNVLNKNCFLVLDDNPAVIELAILKDITLGTPETDWTGETKMLVSERFGGSIIRYPSAIYVGKGI
ncbi:MAG: DUF2184 domain-containing protein [Leptospiraceae bacterium]|nr:DUF2184 domain-containing protein [Leptospiraceae bacterium]MCK6380852.1 DUF2184 domain-containing protein [Leptospiraceae bacterium]